MWICEWDKETRIARVFPAVGKPHDLDNDARCWCVPRYEPVARGTMWVHNEQEQTGEKMAGVA